jgi:hypothetical protein
LASIRGHHLRENPTTVEMTKYTEAE